jgi:6,7-dimethyl-8-ribityllumazine synthase
MSSSSKNLSNVPAVQLDKDNNYKVGIVRSLWNEEVTGQLLEGCRSSLIENNIEAEHVILSEVPGSFELPIAARILLNKHKLDAIICLGCVIKGETDHDKYISQAVANGIMQLSLLTSIPVVFGVLTTNNQEQALARSGGKHGNKGVEAAFTALHMIKLKEMDDPKTQIGF